MPKKTTSNYQADNPLDLAGLRNNIGDIDLKPLLEIFVEDAQAEIAKIKNALDAKDAHLLMQLAHGLKGASATIHAINMRDLCLQMENSARNDDLQPVGEMLTALENELARVRTYGRALKR
jgi:HPt (histidine-containing phosphotransfer) domain-containing protein